LEGLRDEILDAVPVAPPAQPAIGANTEDSEVDAEEDDLEKEEV
jgi:hypothetical protein